MKLKDSIFLKESNQGKLTWGWLSLLLPIILTVIGSVIYLLLSIIVSLIIIVIYKLPSSNINFESTLSALDLILTTAPMILVYFLYVKLIEKRPIWSMGFKLKKGWLSKYIKGFIIGGLLIGLIAILVLLTGSASISYVGVSVGQIIPFILVIIGWIIQGASEEIMMRGHMLPVLSIKWGALIAIVISSLYFSILHIFNSGINLISLVNLSLAGVLFAVYVFYDDSLWGACALHSSWNFVQGNIVGSKVSGLDMNTGNIFLMTPKGNELLSGGAFGLEGSIITTIVLILVIIVISILIKNKKYKNESLSSNI